ncbi:enoyl-CoA hydratase-related protein [Tepidiforma thermophila]|uniref:Methylglutaconyl-CoA hydratase n=1 Tax=Tepidiforma thermophila (strain KCTC 52669 / CGMCC 1.13589 / G233) TaxID=2761530 RepID=A0A2A9HCT8_TEPT2|nr:enoyl-CoA hydratase-related protein [Tepidiforma thermophila]PFG72991.1 methylglutaconyl-CoA hydratase [Tepidiforma thermophila]
MPAIARLPLPPPGAPPGWLADALDALPEDARCLLVDADALAAAPAPSRAELLRLVLGRVPVIAWFEGTLAGAALDLALAADIRICGAAAAISGPSGWPGRLRLLAPAAADRLARGETLAAPDLYAAGLVSALLPAGGAAAEAGRLAAVVASRGPIALELAKEAIWRGLPQPLEQALRFETDLTMLLQTTKDRAEGVRAFLEKRPPAFTGE